MNTTPADLQYPVGKYAPQPYSESVKKQRLEDIRLLPTLLENAVINLDASQLNTAYREGGWTIRQVVHHVADSHINAFCRLKIALTEDRPTIRAYNEKRWAETAEYESVPINISLTLLHALHARFHALLASLNENDWERTYIHPESGKEFSIWHLLGLYAWHSKHHVAHIQSLRERMGW